MIASVIITFYMDSISNAWKLLLVTGAGTGTVLLVRWFWWRINAWSEVSAMIAAAFVSLFLQIGLKMDSDAPKDFAYIMIITVSITTVVWLAVTMLTKPEPRAVLIKFYRKVHPEGPGWKKIAADSGLSHSHESGGLVGQFANWILGCVLIYATLFGIGKIIFHEFAM